MADRKIIAVVGATGAQGGGLVRAIQEDASGSFVARAITRNPGGDKGQALAASGVEVVAGDLDDVATLERAFAGAHGVFGVTNFWEHMFPDREKQQARNQAEAASRTGVRHFVWSTLEDTREFIPLSDDRMPTLMDRYKVPHFDAKAEADAAFRELGVPTTFLRTTFYWDNFIHFGLGPTRGEDGVLALTLPIGDAKLAGMAASDIGRIALGIFRAGESMIGRTISVAGDVNSGKEMAEKLSAAMGEPVQYRPVTPEAFRTFGFPGADDLGNMFRFYQDFAREFAAARPLDEARALHPGLQNLEQWVAANGSRLPRQA
jgi:uncharacterized protein YbjT (DUF2867 family)